MNQTFSKKNNKRIRPRENMIVIIKQSGEISKTKNDFFRRLTEQTSDENEVTKKDVTNNVVNQNAHIMQLE